MLALVSVSIFAAVSLKVPTLRPNWRGTSTPVGPHAIAGAMLGMLSFALAIWGWPVALVGIPLAFVLALYGMARDTGADLRRLGVLVFIGAALILALVLALWLAER